MASGRLFLTLFFFFPLVSHASTLIVNTAETTSGLRDVSVQECEDVLNGVVAGDTIADGEDYVCETNEESPMIAANIFKRLREARELGQRHGVSEEDHRTEQGRLCWFGVLLAMWKVIIEVEPLMKPYSILRLKLQTSYFASNSSHGDSWKQASFREFPCI